METIVIALGGNALINPSQKDTTLEQLLNLKVALKSVAKLVKKYNVVLTHGNGPQVGKILLANENTDSHLPIDVADAMSQGEIGYLIFQTLYNELNKSKIKKEICSILCHVKVDPKDSAFKNPTKPIGKFYSKKDLLKLPKHFIISKISKGKYRRIVPSPKPIKIIEENIVKNLSRKGIIVITGGGGGIPVSNSKKLRGIEAVIDKDSTSELLARKINAKKLIILTNIENVMLNFGKKNQKKLGKITLKNTKKYLKENEFKVGSMKPKINAAINFLEQTKGEVIITSFTNLIKAIEGKKGTKIVR